MKFRNEVARMESKDGRQAAIIKLYRGGYRIILVGTRIELNAESYDKAIRKAFNHGFVNPLMSR